MHPYKVVPQLIKNIFIIYPTISIDFIYLQNKNMQNRQIIINVVGGKRLSNMPFLSKKGFL